MSPPDPRRNLHAWANAGWHRRCTIPAWRSHIDSFGELAERSRHTQIELCREALALPSDHRNPAQQAVAEAWRSVTDTDAIETAGLTPVQADLDAIDRLDTVPCIVDWLHEQQLRGTGLVYALRIEPDHRDPGRGLVVLAPAGLGLPDPRSYDEASPSAHQLANSYRGYIAELAGAAGRPLDPTTIAGLWDLERTLARTLPDRGPGERLSPQSPISLELAAGQFPVLDWPGLLRRLGTASADTSEVSLTCPDWHHALSTLLQERPPAIWRSYLRHRCLDRAAPWLHAALRKARDRLDRQLDGHRCSEPPSHRVIAQVADIANAALSSLFVARTCPARTRRQVPALAEQLRASFLRRIDDSHWLDASTRRAARDKLQRLRLVIAEPGDLPPITPPPRPRHGFEHWRMARQQAMATQLAARHHGVGAMTVVPTVLEANARYDPLGNRVILPAALLQPPLFDPDADIASNLGALGAIIGHEMTHALDTLGSRFDALGRLDHAPWPTTDQQQLQARANRLRDLIAHELPDPPGAAPERLLDEQMADLGGLAIALDALERQLAETPDTPHRPALRRFFRAWARVWRFASTATEPATLPPHCRHPPPAMRANLSARQLPAFAEAFDCRPGDPMWLPEHERLRIW